MASESWLRSDDHEKWAEAMTICRSPAAACGAAGFCRYGDCFKKRSPDIEARIKRLEQELAELRERLK